MQTRPLGRSGIPASVVGFGAWAIGGWTWGGADEDDAVRAIHAFLDAGGSLIDTAPIYGFGRSEQVVGQAIQGRRDKVVLATKCAMRWDLTHAQQAKAARKFSTTQEMVDWSGEPTDDSFDVYIYSEPEGIRAEVERSLQRLKTDVIDLYQTHWQDGPTPIADRMGELMRLKQEGKVRAIGVSNASPEQLDEYAEHGQLDVDQEKYSMLDRAMEQTNLPKCAQESIAFLAYSPLAQGLLTGRVTPDRTYPEDDQRHYKQRFKPDNVRKVLAVLDPMRPIAQRHGVPLAQVTMAWTLAQPGCSHVLCGARNPEQAVDNAGAGSVALSDEELAVITDAVGRYDGV